MASVTHSSPGEPGSGSGSIPNRRPPRSKAGCLTCRRRKVRCNEQKPRCSHCERLNLQCTWRPVTSINQMPRQTSESGNDERMGVNSGHENLSTTTGNSELNDSRQATIDGSFNDMFDYASFMWDHELQSGTMQPTRWRDLGFPDMDVLAQRDEAEETQSMNSSSFLFNGRNPNPQDSIQSLDRADFSGNSRTAFEPSGLNGNSFEERMLKDYFIQTVVPPIIAQVETQLRWSSMRQLLVSMSNNSAMVHYAILAFSELLLGRKSQSQPPKYQKWYDNARLELSRQRTEGIFSGASPSSTTFEHMLAALFFLSYIDLLEGRIVDAHANLKEAYEAFQAADKSQLRMVSKRLISWMRLLDARAVTAGGEGLFLSDNDDIVAQPSPASTEMTEAGGNSNEVCEANVEDVLFDTLYQPGFFFFQRIQSFMGRISKIDPWHRSRGTVEDETEVMSIAAKISRDLGTLWDSRPPLMDYALNGKLTPAHISPSLVFTITRTFRTYFANYNASKIHLHRVAYKHLPLSVDTEKAISNIRNTARLMVEVGAASSPEQEMLPVNMLWPLLMWGTEENDPEVREWIIVQINNMEQVATNAKVTAQVLMEVQKRQDVSKVRVDVRTVMHDIFNSCFAIV
ncbi:uncharacterized protein PAC_19188 [Phialocephala subalpina]|uniref:Zn(2)-C6 fungal-type domain-containing protein n=1 Tax=Phialocephala subalpina TaxID=576137 RepID=A0A1L7XWB1_9HELO|nr:uncharacterized protein PAC_19188 [Phialocephala subalpina]